MSSNAKGCLIPTPPRPIEGEVRDARNLSRSKVVPNCQNPDRHQLMYVVILENGKPTKSQGVAESQKSKLEAILTAFSMLF